MKIDRLCLISLLLLATCTAVWGQQSKSLTGSTPLSETPVAKARIFEFWKSEPTFAIKTNVALLGATVANLGVEVGFSNRFSVDIPFIYSPYTVKDNYKLRVIALQPELRYWLDKSFKGHFFGFHAHLGWFNVAVDHDWRYQSRGSSPLWGVGVSYGYDLPLAEHWVAEFTLGAGYAHIPYEKCYNVTNGARYDSGVKDYWGITRAGITLVYKFK